MAGVALRIGEVARRAGLSVRTLRHYDDLGLLVPSARSHGAQRLYSPEDVRRLLTIQHLKALGLSLAEVGAALDDPGVDARAALAQHIAAVEDRQRELDHLLRRLRRLQSAAEAGWEEVLGVVALTERLNHPEAGVRVRAALDGGADVPLDTLLERLADEPDDQVADTLTWAVARHGPDAAGPVARRLAKLREPGSLPALSAALADDDPGVAAAAVVALGRIGDPAALPALVDRLGGADEALVTDAVVGFGGAAVTPLTRALRRGDPGTRRHAAEVLGRIGDPAAASALAERLTDEDATVRLAAVQALGQLPGDDAGHALRRAAASEDPRVRAVAARCAADRTGDLRVRAGRASRSR